MMATDSRIFYSALQTQLPSMFNRNECTSWHHSLEWEREAGILHSKPVDSKPVAAILTFNYLLALHSTYLSASSSAMASVNEPTSVYECVCMFVWMYVCVFAFMKTAFKFIMQNSFENFCNNYLP